VCRSETLWRASTSPVFAVVAAPALRVMVRDRAPDQICDLGRALGGAPLPGSRTRAQGPQADELGEVLDRFERTAAAGAEVADVIRRRACAPHAGATRRALGVRHPHGCRRALGDR
jgi:hypothetical protein